MADKMPIRWAQSSERVCLSERKEAREEDKVLER